MTRYLLEIEILSKDKGIMGRRNTFFFANDTMEAVTKANEMINQHIQAKLSLVEIVVDKLKLK